MLIAYHPIYQSKKENDYDRQPELFVGQAVQFLLSLRTTDFDIRYKDGVAEVSLARHMSPKEIKTMALAIVDAADAAIRQEKEWDMAQAALNVEPVDDTCSACDGSGKLGE